MEAKMWNHSEWISETDPYELENLFFEKLNEAGFTILKYDSHVFDGGGVTGFFILAESHFAYHTWPEEKRTYIELSSCNLEKQMLFLKSIKNIKTP